MATPKLFSPEEAKRRSTESIARSNKTASDYGNHELLMQASREGSVITIKDENALGIPQSSTSINQHAPSKHSQNNLPTDLFLADHISLQRNSLADDSITNDEDDTQPNKLRETSQTRSILQKG